MNIKLLVMDVDGTLTDGKLYYTAKEEEIKAFNVKDGYGINKHLPSRQVIPAIITGRSSLALEQRCVDLNITHLYQGVTDKLAVLKKLLSELDISLDVVAYIGDDDNDLDCMNAVALAACPADASQNVKKVAAYISDKNGGEGAVRSFIDWMIEKDYI